MAALFPSGLETTPSSHLRRVQPSSRGPVIRFAMTVIGMSLLLLLAGGILLKTASGLQPDKAASSAGTAAVDKAQASAQPWEYSGATLPPPLPREWLWEPPGARVDHMFMHREGR